MQVFSVNFAKFLKISFSQNTSWRLNVKIMKCFLSTNNFNLENLTEEMQPSIDVLRQGCSEKCSKFTGEQPCRCVIQWSCKITLLKSHFGMGVLLEICCIFSEHLFLRIPQECSFWSKSMNFLRKISDKAPV